MVLYLDDILLIHASLEGLVVFVSEATNLLRHLGFINMGKSVFTPKQRIEFLGTIVDTKAFSFFLPVEKFRNLKTNLRLH